jgi:hypothetical protein
MAPAPSAPRPRSSVLPISSLVHKEASKRSKRRSTRVFCGHCSYSASFPCDVKKHIRAVHTGERPFVCAHCGKGFADKSNLNAHEASHTTVFVCPHPGCGKTYSHRASVRAHTLTHDNRMFGCSICLKTYANPPNVIRHLHRAHPGQGGVAVQCASACSPEAKTASLEMLALQAAAILAQQLQ